MKKFLSLLVLLTPLVSLSMDTMENARKALDKKVANASDTQNVNAAVNALAKKVSSAEELAAVSKKDAVNVDESDECTVFTESLREMRYHHINDYLLRLGFRASIAMALTQGDKLFSAVDKKVEAENDPQALSIELLQRAKLKLANIIDLTCGKIDFQAEVESIYKGITSKHKEAYPVTTGNEPKKNRVIHDVETYETLTYMLTKYGELTGVTRKDMLFGHELIAKRMVEKALEAKAFAQSALVKPVEKK